jgi:hypothetical protein
MQKYSITSKANNDQSWWRMLWKDEHKNVIENKDGEIWQKKAIFKKNNSMNRKISLKMCKVSLQEVEWRFCS